MGLVQKISNLLEYQVAIDLSTRLSWKQALFIITTFILVLVMLINIVSQKYLYPRQGGVFERKIAALAKTSKQTNYASNKTEIALAYYLEGNLEKAQSLFESVLQQDKNNSKANIYYGLMLADQKKYQQAIPYLEKGIAQEPTQAQLAYLYLGISYFFSNNTSKALEYLETSTKLEPGSPAGYYFFGLANKKKGDYLKAKILFEKAIQLSGGNYPEAVQELRGLTKQRFK